ncbi:hypothetical protein HAX54_022478 [Datura stramonium]|uniref:Uncharacterized protein n=1 Tax=Datura stramonium TaxID=4076 RepID=A0ABS8UUM4_DATST|nr:hypothetical protein [Datura stramonium]
MKPHFQNPNPNHNPSSIPADQPYNPAVVRSQFASAPPIASGDYSNYASSYPPYSQPSADHAPNPLALFPSNPNSQSSYGFPHLEVPQRNYYPYDQNQARVSYDFAASGADYQTPNSPNYNLLNSLAPYSSTSFGVSAGTNYGNSFENNSNYGSYGDQGLYESGVYKYNGKKEESYSGNRSQSSANLMFDDYGRPLNVNSGREQQGAVSTPKVVKATPKIEDQQDVTDGVLKFRVKILSEGIGQTDMDVLCQIGLDGIRILDPGTTRTLRIYSLENMMRWEVLDSYIFAFWAKTSVDNEAKRIRLKSNSYTTNNILDAVTATSIQAEVTQRLSNAKAGVRVVALPSHVDLAKKLQEEMDKKRKTSAGLTCQGSRRMREVACPTCTVHLQVEVPTSGSETIECSICQHPFLVSSH